MIKTVLIAALLCLASTQNAQSLIDQANAASNGFLSQNVQVVENANSLVVSVADYEYVLTEANNEYEINANSLSNNANNLAPTLAALLANVANVAQNDNAEIASVLDTEAQSLGVEVQDGGAIAAGAASEYAGQLQNNAESIGVAAANGFDQASAAFNSNQNGAADQINQQLNQNLQNQELAAQNAENLAVQGVASIPADVASPDQVDANTAPFSQAIVEAANSANSGQVSNDVNNLVGQASNAVNNLQGNAPAVASNAASAATESASQSLNAAGNSLGAGVVADNAGAIASSNLGN